MVENDANCHAWAETRFGAARGQQTVLAITLGTGIGCGIVIEGALFRGGFGVAGEPGHMRVVPGGRLCGCGNRGCWEQYASGNALAREAREMAQLAPISMPHLIASVGGDIDAITGPLVTDAARAGDEGALQCFDTVGRWVGQGLADLATILDPGCFVIGGGAADAGPLILDPARVCVRRCAQRRQLPPACADSCGRTRQRGGPGRRGRSRSVSLARPAGAR